MPLPLLLPRFLRTAADNFDLLRMDIVLIIELEIDILDEESPNFVAKAICVQMTLLPICCQLETRKHRPRGDLYLEVHARLDLVGQHFGDILVEEGDDFHGSLRLDAAGVDQVIKCVNERHADAVIVAVSVSWT